MVAPITATKIRQINQAGIRTAELDRQLRRCTTSRVAASRVTVTIDGKDRIANVVASAAAIQQLRSLPYFQGRTFSHRLIARVAA